MNRFQRRTILSLILGTLLLTAPAVSAAPLSAVETRTVLAQLWSFLTGGAWVPVSPDTGCSYDPDGMHCAGGSAALAGDIGCSYDPSGLGCRGGSAAPSSDIGCSYDPNGSCHTGG